MYRTLFHYSMRLEILFQKVTALWLTEEEIKTWKTSIIVSMHSREANLLCLFVEMSDLKIFNRSLLAMRGIKYPQVGPVAFCEGSLNGLQCRTKIVKGIWGPNRKASHNLAEAPSSASETAVPVITRRRSNLKWTDSGCRLQWPWKP